ncbi:MAG: UDP-2,4-diacetamido-2,4,6-trideoxy-beta-L-altropyranose hydrolase [Clostridium sp.]|jgi:UDP-2,4-diacetamido-2,4,6-trideoxy-beta-L-altropyranose hydrolase|nr:UDP-2,4-diacetamido-2,4,6-trideoxy-beta-L-altropyranose hydrolase [Clostridium sp.]
MDTIYFRTDSNPVIATGHLMRCLAIADAAKKQRIRSVFLTADGQSADVLESRGYENIVLHSRWDKLEEEIPVLLPLIRNRRIGVLLVDSYGASPEYFAALRPCTKTAYIDDLGRTEYPCHLLLNYTVYWEKYRYPERYPQGTELLLGCSYAPLREQFSDPPLKQVSAGVRRILILTGGSDPCHAARSLTEAFLSLPECEGVSLTVVCGRFSPDLEFLEETASRRGNLAVLSDVAEMASHLCRADLAVSAGGTSLYELCACGTPGISYAVADNQLDNVAAFARLGLIDYAGDAREGMAQVCDACVRLFHRLLPQETRRGRACAMRALVDGKGSARIVAAIREWRAGGIEG